LSRLLHWLERRLCLASALLALAVTVPGAAQTRAVADAADRHRDCGVPADAASPQMHAVRCAEWFIARQGYTNAAPVSDTLLVMAEGIEWEPSRREWLRRRHGSLSARALAVCKSGHGFNVPFLVPGGAYARGVTMDERYGSLRVQHSGFELDYLRKAKTGCRLIGALPRAGK
jgi:hypothetical protein